jgi:hypothetical protein
MGQGHPGGLVDRLDAVDLGGGGADALQQPLGVLEPFGVRADDAQR